MKPVQAAELIHLLHAHGQDGLLAELATDAAMYAAPGPKSTRAVEEYYGSQAEIALMGLEWREFENSASTPGVDAALLQILRTLSDPKYMGFVDSTLDSLPGFLGRRSAAPLPQDVATWPKFASLARRLAERLAEMRHDHPSAIAALNAWADALERAIAKREGQRTKSKSASRSQTATTRRTKKKTKWR